MVRTLTIAFLSFFLAVVIVGGGAFLWANNTESESLMDSLDKSIASLPLGKSTPEVKARKDTLRILVAGVGGKGHPGSFLTDTLIVVEIDNTSEEVNLISIPRDLLVYTDDGYYRKINSVYTTAYQEHENEARALRKLTGEVEEITGVGIDHYARVDFNGFKELVNTLDGVTVEVKEDINDPYYPDGNYGYDPFKIEKGTHTLDGERALKYARTRYTSTQGDFDRAKRQQQVIDQLRKKLSDLNPVWNADKVVSLARTAKRNLKTDISLQGFQRLYRVYDNLSNYETNSLVLGRDLPHSTLKEDERSFGGEEGYVLVPRAGEQTYWEIHEKIKHIGRNKAYENRKEQVKEESARITVYSSLSETETEKMKGLLRSYGMDITVRRKVPRQFQDGKNHLSVMDTEQIPYTRGYLKERFGISQTVSEKNTIGQELTAPEKRRLNTTNAVESETEQDMALYLNDNPFDS